MALRNSGELQRGWLAVLLMAMAFIGSGLWTAAMSQSETGQAPGSAHSAKSSVDAYRFAETR